jgi:hypothetical protein
MGCIRTKAILTPAGTVMVVALGAGFAEATESFCSESGFGAVVCCATPTPEKVKVIEANIRVFSVSFQLILCLVRREKRRRRRFGDISDTS